MIYPEIAARLFATPLMLHPAKAEIIARAFGPRVLGVPDLPMEMHGGEHMGLVGDGLREVRDWEGHPIYQGPKMISSGVALIEVEGSLVNKGKWLGKSSGMTTYEAIGVQADDCRESSAVKGVIVEVDSFGGEVSGAFDCAERLFEMARAKPTIAVLTDHACSAGYLLASACRQVFVPQNGIVGSIGVIAMHVDMSKWLAREGLAVTLLKAGARKSDLNPYEPLPAEVVERELADLEAVRGDFAATVARYRAGRISLDQALATEAGVYRGQAAVDAGLADTVARPSQVLAAFEEELGRFAG
jgi:ClpP class serine protease